MVSFVGLQCVIVVFPDHTHLLFYKDNKWFITEKQMNFFVSWCIMWLTLFRSVEI